MFLIYDPEHRGHHGEYLENLIYGLKDTKGYLMYASPRLKTRLQEAKRRSGSNLQLEYFDEDWIAQLLDTHGLLKRGRIETEMALRLVGDLKATHLLLMQMNMNQFFIGLWRNRIPCLVRGIVLNHYTPLSRAHSYWGKLQALVTGVRKLLMYRWLLRCKLIERVFILNDPKVVEQLNRRLQCGHKFDALVDPLPYFKGLALPEVGCEEFYGSDRTVFLLAGSIAPRKGCVELLHALEALPHQMTSRIRLRILGHFRTEAYWNEVQLAAQELLIRRPEMEIELQPKFLSNQDFLMALRSCDFVLAPYINFYGSSGILAHACAAGKPVLACRDGWLGERVRTLALGATFQPKDRGEFSAVLSRAMQGEVQFDLRNAQEYVAHASLASFCEVLTRK